jgi:4-phytase/acid phosphatase
MTARSAILWALAALLASAVPAMAGPLKLERVVLVQRHGVRPPVASNADLAKYAAQPWPAWSVPAGELTAHGGEVVRLMGQTLRQAYVTDGLLPAKGCPGADEVQVWADGTDQRTRLSGQILAEALAPGCGTKTGWAPPVPRDPVFGGDNTPACRLDPDAARAAVMSQAGPEGLDTPGTRRALARLQSILAPDACAGGKGTCFAGKDEVTRGGFAGVQISGPLAVTSSLAEDLLLEYAEGMAPADVGWGKAASARTIAEVMPLHERNFSLWLGTPYVAARRGALTARLILAELAGDAVPPSVGPRVGPTTKVLALDGHDSNLAFMGAVFGLRWTLPDQPDATAPANTLAFELWRDATTGRRYVRAVLYYEPLEQMRSLSPAAAARRPLTFDGCASGPGGACPLEDLSRRTRALIPAECSAF